ncbi:response regulator [Pontibacillus litoralis]|uniref:Response regulatory domain-containing protein n=1 Tax=Pontibacillus litoralis JSM 072002 TaxID=1385512 RepID=A0A0A5G341_9BACI|nr:response regulator [Pontibacillus litoralis]KGX86469.1 hypothetical protein N784_04760 [Pontibacillus litoralis JSM 072002]
MGKRVLIVDDQSGIRFLLQEVIKNKGCQTFEAKTGQEAIEQVKQHEPDFIFIDLKLPIKDGITVLTELEAEGYAIPAVMMSGLTQMEWNELSLPRNVRGTITKPFDIEEIERIITEFCNVKR